MIVELDLDGQQVIESLDHRRAGLGVFKTHKPAG